MLSTPTEERKYICSPEVSLERGEGLLFQQAKQTFKLAFANFTLQTRASGDRRSRIEALIACRVCNRELRSE